MFCKSSQHDGHALLCIHLTNLVKPRFHYLCRLFGQVAALSRFPMLIFVMAGHEKGRNIPLVGVLTK
jgi:hypothetical protein